MFDSPPAPAETGLELATVRRTRRITIEVTAAIAVGASVFLAATQFSIFPRNQALVAFSSLLIFIMMMARRHTDVGAWWGIAGILLISASAWFSDPLSDARLSASTLLFIAGYFGIIMLAPRFQLPWVAGVAIVWALIVPSVPLEVTMFGALHNLRWATLIQLVTSSLWLALAWNHENRQIALRDASLRSDEQEAADAATLRERLRVWRESRVRIHETVLNDIRSVLDAQSLDRERLARQLRDAIDDDPPRLAQYRLAEVVSSLHGLQGPGKTLIVSKLADVSLPNRRAQAVRTALLELTRNMFRHGGCNEVTIGAVASRDELLITLRPDAGTAAPTHQPAGMGAGVVLADALTDAGGHLTFGDGSVSVQLSLLAPVEEIRSLARPDAGRIVISSIAAGNAIGGLYHYVALAGRFGSDGMLAAAATVLTVAIAAVATWRRRTIPPAAVIAATIAATATPLLVAQLLSGCSDAELLVYVATLCSMAFSAAVVWAPSLRWWWLALAPAAGIAYLSTVALESCTRSVIPSLNTSLIAPGTLAIIYVALTRSARREEKLRVMHLTAIAESAAAAAARDVARDLHSAVARSRQILSGIAAGAPLTDADRRQLRCIDSEIRAAVQTDPEAAGAFTLAARNSVHKAVRAEVPVRVLALRDSGDRRPLAPSVVDAVSRLFMASTDAEASIQVLTTGSEDTLVLTTSAAAAKQAGLSAGWELSVDGAMARLDYAVDEPAVLIVQRSVVPATTSTTR